MNSAEEKLSEALERIDQRLANLEELAFRDIRRLAREIAERVVAEELSQL